MTDRSDPGSGLEVQLRPFVTRDLGQVRGIDADVFESALTGEILIELLIDYPELQFVATHGDKVVGYITCRPEGAVLYIPRMGVHPDHRREGIGRRLLERVFTARNRDQAVVLHVRASNDAAIGLYMEAFGFVVVDEEPDYYGAGQHGLKLRAGPIGTR